MKVYHAVMTQGTVTFFTQEERDEFIGDRTDVAVPCESEVTGEEEQNLRAIMEAIGEK